MNLKHIIIHCNLISNDLFIYQFKQIKHLFYTKKFKCFTLKCNSLYTHTRTFRLRFVFYIGNFFLQYLRHSNPIISKQDDIATAKSVQ